MDGRIGGPKRLEKKNKVVFDWLVFFLLLFTVVVVIEFRRSDGSAFRDDGLRTTDLRRLGIAKADTHGQRQHVNNASFGILIVILLLKQNTNFL